MANRKRFDRAMEKYLLEKADSNIQDNKFIRKSFDSIDSDFNAISSNIKFLNKKITAEQNRKLDYKKDYNEVKKDVSNINSKYNKLLSKIKTTSENTLKISNIKIQDQGKELLGEITKTNAKIDRFIKSSKQSVSEARKEIAEEAQTKIKEIRKKVTNNEARQLKLEENVSELIKNTEETVRKISLEQSKKQKKELEGFSKNLKQIKLQSAERESKTILEIAKNATYLDDYKKQFSLEIKKLNLVIEKKNSEILELKKSISKLTNYDDKKVMNKIEELNKKLLQIKAYDDELILDKIENINSKISKHQNYDDRKIWDKINSLTKEISKKNRISSVKEDQVKAPVANISSTPKHKKETSKKLKNFLFNLFFEEVKEKPVKTQKTTSKKQTKTKKSSKKPTKLEVIEPWSKVEKVKKQN